jgi:hypothetical protein
MIARLVHHLDQKRVTLAMNVTHVQHVQSVQILIHAIAHQRRSGHHKKFATPSAQRAMVIVQHALPRSQQLLSLIALTSSIRWRQSQLKDSEQSLLQRRPVRRLHLKLQSLVVQESQR